MGGIGSHELTVTTPTDLEIVFTREFDAPRELVFEAHTSCEHLSHWWGARSARFVSCELDFRPGGAWRIVLGTGRGEVTFFGEYLEIVRPERIVRTFGFNDTAGGPETYRFEEADGKTIIRRRAVFGSVEDRDAALAAGMAAGAAESYERLDELLEALRKAATA
jgi:uncharacterized protein YndB with AHSA1/START domain